MQLRIFHLRIAVGFLMVCFSVGVLCSLFLFGTALRQEKDTPDILRVVLSMELTRVNVAEVNSNQKRLLVKTFSSLKTHLEKQGWIWTDQAGAIVSYRKGNQNLHASCGMYSRNYMICDLSQTP
jgi:hypothetical protein